ncbi:hypothetical protein SCOR_25170 [Sulfidibacter corallicola]|uniref:Uncharacterized protein n=1 Tax=Sulfidibacter corallicola TaxID=2818388 RepID=A0A8A4TT15_SULCO|nr:hypothetical protein [Sulfidibacter corallicola]QTD52304.1 hypothetical protein J3U87_07500 [Sulfidibacter corallicola]
MRKPHFIDCLRRALPAVPRYPRTLLTLLFANLVAALVCLAPFWMAFESYSKRRVVGDGGLLDPHFLVDFLFYRQGSWDLAKGMLPISIGLYALFSVFLSGGVFSVLFQGRGDHAALFWRDAGRFFPKFVMLLVWSIPLFALAPLLHGGVLLALEAIYGPELPAAVEFYGGWAALALPALGWLLYLRVFDYARIYMVTTGQAPASLALYEGVVFVGRRFFSVVGLALSVAVVLALWFWLYAEARGFLPESGWLLILLQQIWMLGRQAARLWLYDAELRLFRKLRTRAPLKAVGLPPRRRLPV